MEDNRRSEPRYNVSLFAEYVEPKTMPIHIRNLSATGFLVRGDVCAGQGGIFRARFRVHPSSGESKVTAKGKVVHCRIAGSDSEFGIKIDGFDSPEEETAYQAYVRELQEKPALKAY